MAVTSLKIVILILGITCCVSYCDAEKDNTAILPFSSSHHHTFSFSYLLKGPEFLIDTDKVLVKDFKGFGTQYNQNLYASISEVDGISEDNIRNLESKVILLNSQFVRIFFDSRAFDKVNYPDYMNSFVRTVKLAQASGSEVNITWWHGPYTDISQQMLDFAKVLEDLISVRKLSCVKSITIQNEVNSTAITLTTYEKLYRELDKHLKSLGLRDSLQFIGGDLVRTNHKQWFDFMASNLADVLDAYSVHIYWNYWDQAYGKTRLKEVHEIVKAMPAASQKPVYITEFGIRGEKIPGTEPGCIKGTIIPIGTTTVNAFQHAWFQILAMNLGYAGFIKWDAYKAKYDKGTQYHALIGSGSQNYPLYPAWYSTWLFTHTSKPGWQVNSIYNGGVDSNKYVSVLKDPKSGDLSIYALNDTGKKSSFTIGGLAAGKGYNLLIWNAEGKGEISKNSPVRANPSGVVSVDIKRESFVVLTTLDVNLSLITMKN